MKLTSVATQQLDDLSERCALLVASCGFESRSTQVAMMFGGHADRKITFGFDRQKLLSYSRNRDWFDRNGFEYIECSDDEFGEQISGLLGEASCTSRPVVIDISCMNRSRLAHCTQAIKSLSGDLDVAFVYNVALFSPPPEEAGPTTVVEPVLPELAGWTTSPERPVAALMGLGYEQSRAIGIVDHLEINDAIWAFLPAGPILDYLPSVEAANASFLSLLNSDGRKILYDVMNPSALLRDVNGLVDLLKSSYNPILIPFGPKIFALVALLVANQHDEVGVWRVSGGAMSEPCDRGGSEFCVVLRSRFVSVLERS